MTTNSFSPKEVVRINNKCPDPALDLTKMDVEAYSKSRDFALVKVLDGQAPTVFIVDRVSYQLAQAYRRQPDMEFRQQMAFASACQRVNLPNGSTLTPSKTTTLKLGGQSFETADDDWLQLITDTFGFDTILEIGQVAMDLATLPKDAKAGFSFWLGRVQSS